MVVIVEKSFVLPPEFCPTNSKEFCELCDLTSSPFGHLVSLKAQINNSELKRQEEKCTECGPLMTPSGHKLHLQRPIKRVESC